MRMNSKQPDSIPLSDHVDYDWKKDTKQTVPALLHFYFIFFLLFGSILIKPQPSPKWLQHKLKSKYDTFLESWYFEYRDQNVQPWITSQLSKCEHSI